MEQWLGTCLSLVWGLCMDATTSATAATTMSFVLNDCWYNFCVNTSSTAWWCRAGKYNDKLLCATIYEYEIIEGRTVWISWRRSSMAIPGAVDARVDALLCGFMMSECTWWHGIRYENVPGKMMQLMGLETATRALPSDHPLHGKEISAMSNTTTNAPTWWAEVFVICSVVLLLWFRGCL